MTVCVLGGWGLQSSKEFMELYVDDCFRSCSTDGTTDPSVSQFCFVEHHSDNQIHATNR